MKRFRLDGFLDGYNKSFVIRSAPYKLYYNHSKVKDDLIISESYFSFNRDDCDDPFDYSPCYLLTIARYINDKVGEDEIICIGKDSFYEISDILRKNSVSPIVSTNISLRFIYHIPAFHDHTIKSVDVMSPDESAEYFEKKLSLVSNMRMDEALR